MGVSWSVLPLTVASRRWRSRTRFGPEDETLARDPIAEASQDPVDPGSELGIVVGLGDVVLGDLLEQVGLGIAGVDRREDDDREVGPALDLTRERQAVHARHHHVDDEQVGPGDLQPPEGLDAVSRRGHLEAIGPELVRERDEQIGIVVDDQDARPRRAIGTAGSAHHRPRITGAVAPTAHRPQGALGSTNLQRGATGQAAWSGFRA